MRVLHISNKPAFPLRDGGCVAIKSMLQSLITADSIFVYHFTLNTHKHPFDINAYPDNWKKEAEVENHFINTKTDILGALIHLIKNKSYNIARFYDKKVSKRLDSLVASGMFDIVILEGIYLLPYLTIFKKHNVKVVVRAHNVEYSIWDELSKSAKNPLKKWYFNKLSKQLKRYELEYLNEIEGIIAITKNDRDLFVKNGVKTPITVIPTSVKGNYSAPNYDLNDFYFLGAMDWLPNKEGVDWLINNVVKGNDIPQQIHIGGKSLKRNEINENNIVCHGEIKKAKDFIDQHGICLIPLISGSGLKIKLLENMALGKPIITTSTGANGIDVVDRKHVLIANTPDEFIKAMREMSSSKKLRISLGNSAQKFVIDNFGEQKITKQLIEFLQNI